MSQQLARLAQNLASVEESISAACRRAGRARDEVRLVAVTKYVSLEVARELISLGCFDLGESRPQELWRKAEALADLPVRWHVIGHLQRNKARRTVPLADLIHSVESLELAREIARSSTNLPTRVLVEVNVSGDATKHGLAPGEVGTFIEQTLAFEGLDVRGLMTMAARDGDLNVARENFKALRRLRDELRTTFGDRCDLSELSMGMSGDYEVAIEEGATLVRVGSALFEGIEA